MSVSEHEATCDTCRALHWRDDLRYGQCQECRDMEKAVKERRRAQVPWVPFSQREIKS